MRDVEPINGVMFFLGWAMVLIGGVAFGFAICYQLYVAQQKPAEVPIPRELPPGVSTFHDASHGVTCWTTGGAGDPRGIACLPDELATFDPNAP